MFIVQLLIVILKVLLNRSLSINVLLTDKKKIRSLNCDFAILYCYLVVSISDFKYCTSEKDSLFCPKNLFVTILTKLVLS